MQFGFIAFFLFFCWWGSRDHLDIYNSRMQELFLKVVASWW